MFDDRAQAGRLLAEKLRAYRGTDAVILALPRGGVVPAYEIARALALPLDIIAIRKIGHPTDPEYAIGAVDQNSMTLMEKTEERAVNQEWLREEVVRQRREAKRRSVLYRAGHASEALEGRTVILVDDGIATGLTMRLAVRAIRAQKPEKIVVAVPVAAPESIGALAREGVDRTITLEPPEEFLGAVGAHYAHFEQVLDEEVIRLMRSSYEERGGS